MQHLNTHKHIIPILYTLIWGVGLYSCSWDWELLPTLTTYSNTVQGITVIYLIFMAECIVALWDVAYCHKRATFNVHIIYWLILFVLNVLITLILTILFFRCSEFSYPIGFLICISMTLLKYLNVYFTNNTDKYLHPIIINTYSSTF